MKPLVRDKKEWADQWRAEPGAASSSIQWKEEPTPGRPELVGRELIFKHWGYTITFRASTLESVFSLNSSADKQSRWRTPTDGTKKNMKEQTHATEGLTCRTLCCYGDFFLSSLNWKKQTNKWFHTIVCSYNVKLSNIFHSNKKLFSDWFWFVRRYIE